MKGASVKVAILNFFTRQDPFIHHAKFHLQLRPPSFYALRFTLQGFQWSVASRWKGVDFFLNSSFAYQQKYIQLPSLNVRWREHIS